MALFPGKVGLIFSTHTKPKTRYCCCCCCWFYYVKFICLACFHFHLCQPQPQQQSSQAQEEMSWDHVNDLSEAPVIYSYFYLRPHTTRKYPNTPICSLKSGPLVVPTRADTCCSLHNRSAIFEVMYSNKNKTKQNICNFPLRRYNLQVFGHWKVSDFMYTAVC